MVVNAPSIFVHVAAVTIAVVHVITALPARNSTEDCEARYVLAIARVPVTVKPEHCADLRKAGQRNSGVYTVFHGSAGRSGQDVYCDMKTDGGGWTVIQKRGQFENNALYFYRNWTQYALGFGNPAKEYWIGNEALHTLTSSGEAMMLQVVLVNSTGIGVRLIYESFQVSNASQNYTLRIGKFRGPAGWDALRSANNMKFSTFDWDNDLDSRNNCAQHFKGAWWYDNCYRSHLNGVNYNGLTDGLVGGIEWITTGAGGKFHSYPWAQMMIRPVAFAERH